MIKRLFLATSVLLFGVCLSLAGGSYALAKDLVAGQGLVDYQRDIKPLLSGTCYACHGPDAKKREADLRLDLRESAIESAVEPGKSAESELIKRITSTDPDEQMPPPDSNKKPLTKEQIKKLRQWIDAGAKFDAHWSYRPLSRPDVPKTKDAARSPKAIDRFISAGRDKQGLKPAAEADAHTLIRRLSFDLTGLPPTPEEVDTMIAETSEQAYEKLVDRLLASKHYGERMAMYWLDLVRYADTNGIHGDNHRDHFLYRDYVIEAFNNNKPFDEFTIEQLAGDLLPNATFEQKIASGYNRLNMTTREGGAQPKEYRAKYAADRVRNASIVWFASTMGCCECHDHKYDPFTTKDFYSLAAFFADIEETAVGVQKSVKLPSPMSRDVIAKFEQQAAPLREKLSQQTAALDAEQTAWEASLKTRKTGWTVVRPVSAKSDGGATLTIAKDGSILAGGKNPANATYTLTFSSNLKAISGVRLEVLPHDSFQRKGPGRASNGNFVLNEIELSAAGKRVKWGPVSASHQQTSYPASAAADGNPATGWAILPEVGRANSLILETTKNVGKPGGVTPLTIVMKHQYGTSHTIGRFRISVTEASRPVRAGGGNGLPAPLATILKTEPAKRTAVQNNQLATYFRTIAPSLQTLRTELATLNAERDKASQIAPILIAKSIKPRTMRILPRGNWLDDSGTIVQPQVPESLHPLKIEGRRPTRLDLAHWIVDRKNPLTARVLVNRLWKINFGKGLAANLDDFGSQGGLPEHPELLDWLAVELIDSGWNIKHIMKLMVMSRTYRQSSVATAATKKIDPANRWYARQDRYRLDAEMVRDNALSISGLLVRKVGGPSAKPYQPSGYWAHLNFPRRVYKHDKGENQYRRGLYTYWCRTFLHPSLFAFDAPSREDCTVERSRSNTPLAALVLLNDPTYFESARMLAQRMLLEGGPDFSSRLKHAYRLALGRAPRADETAILAKIYDKHKREYIADQKSATQVGEVGEATNLKSLNPAELAAMTSVARVILNLHETITRN